MGVGRGAGDLELPEVEVLRVSARVRGGETGAKGFVLGGS